MTRGTLLTIGTTALNLARLLRGLDAGAAKNYGALLNDQVRAIQFKCDTGTIYLGDSSAVSNTDYSQKLLAGESKLISDAEAATLNLSDFWLVGSGAGTKVSVEFTTV